MGVQPIAVPQSLAYVLNSAGSRSGVDFDYLLTTAMRESSLDPGAKAPGSSAVGLFQFLDSTWLQVMKSEGPRLGYQKYADAITQDANGDYVIKDKALRAEVLKLREDPQIAADMAAAFTRSNGAYLQSKFGRMPSPGELYIAHFLGPQGAEKFFNAGLADPDQIAAKLFPRQAKANSQIFYSDGQPRTIREVYRALVAQHSGIAAPPADDPRFLAQQFANAPESRWSTDVLPSRFSRDDLSFSAMFSTEAASATPRSPMAVDAIQSLLSPDIAAPLMNAYAPVNESAPLDLGFEPLPAPAPLTPLDLLPQPPLPQEIVSPPGAPLALVPQELMSPSPDDGAPRPRVLMTHPAAGSSAFFTQLQGQN